MEASHNSHAARVMQTVWPWRMVVQPAEQSGHRVRVAIEVAIATVVGLVCLWVLDRPWLGGSVLTLASLRLVAGFLIPPLDRRLDRFGSLLGSWAGIATTWLLLVPFFYIVFTTGRACLMLRGQDPLHRAYEPKLKSYWGERKRNNDPMRYTHQY